MLIVLKGVGAFALVLGLVHLFLPRFLDYRSIVENPALAADPRPVPFRILGYTTNRRDLMGIVWVMNNAASYGLIVIGVADLFATAWLLDAGRPVLVVIGGWWLVRAVSQVAMGTRPGDWLIMAWFALLAVLHGAAFLI